MQCLIIADNERQAIFIQKGLHYENLSADVAHYSSVARLQVRIPYYDGIFLLLDSVETLREYALFCRGVKSDIPIILLLRSDNEAARNLLLELSLNYCAVRPFSFRTIASEMRIAIFHSREALEQSTFTVRDLELDLLSHQVKCKGREIRLRNKEFALLHFLMINEGKLFSRSSILEQVWDHNANILTNTVDVHVSQLRKKIRAHTDDTYVHTVPCRGYFFA